MTRLLRWLERGQDGTINKNLGSDLSLGQVRKSSVPLESWNPDRLCHWGETAGSVPQISEPAMVDI